MRSEKLTVEKEYSEILAQIKFTDEISFKLLGFVPLATGATVLGLLHSDKLADISIVFAVSSFAAIIVLGLFRWELRNIQTCAWLLSRALEIDGQHRPESPGKVGKTEAECLIYEATIALWVALPWVLAGMKTRPELLVPPTLLTALIHAGVSAWVLLRLRKGISDIGAALKFIRDQRAHAAAAL